MNHLGIEKPLISTVMIGISEFIYYHNLVTELPLKNVYKEFWKEQSGYGTLVKSVHNVKRYLEFCRAHSKLKILIICKETEAADALSARLGTWVQCMVKNLMLTTLSWNVRIKRRNYFNLLFYTLVNFSYYSILKCP